MLVIILLSNILNIYIIFKNNRKNRQKLGIRYNFSTYMFKNIIILLNSFKLKK